MHKKHIYPSLLLIFQFNLVIFKIYKIFVPLNYIVFKQMNSTWLKLKQKKARKMKK